MLAPTTPDLGLPDLDGSPKQVAWANDLRARLLVRVGQLVSEGKMRAEDRETMLASLRTQAHARSAKWWIDSRDALAKTVSLRDL